jgi:hypothetical protein
VFLLTMFNDTSIKSYLLMGIRYKIQMSTNENDDGCGKLLQRDAYVLSTTYLRILKVYILPARCKLELGPGTEPWKSYNLKNMLFAVLCKVLYVLGFDLFNTSLTICYLVVSTFSLTVSLIQRSACVHVVYICFRVIPCAVFTDCLLELII